MASADAIYRYYKLEGHSVAETKVRFGIKDRRVYAAVKEVEQRGRVDRIDVSSAAGSAAICVGDGRDGGASVPDEIAGDDTEWVCPAYGMKLPIVPGTKKTVWEAERLARKARHLDALRWLQESERRRKEQRADKLNYLQNAPALPPVPASAENADLRGPAPAPAQSFYGSVITTAPAPAPVVRDTQYFVAPALWPHPTVKAIFLGWLLEYWRFVLGLVVGVVLLLYLAGVH